jgi:N-formylglutamate amidohydrolase
MKEKKEFYTLYRGTAPLLISLPHVGTEIPREIQSKLTSTALNRDDTDWHLEKVYEFCLEMGASLLVPRYSRYVIDLNRPPENTVMYPGKNNTGLCPVQSFSGEALYMDDTPTDFEIENRIQQYWHPYHTALEAELNRLKSAYGFALLWDGHSIKSRLPWLFEGSLPDLNLGTAEGESCDPSLEDQLRAVLSTKKSYTYAVNGRFKGGYITRRYGQPNRGIHAVQLEMSLSNYMQETPPYHLDIEKYKKIEPILKELIKTMLAWKPNHG